MKRYRYQALNRQGISQTGEITADNMFDAQNELARQGLYIYELKRCQIWQELRQLHNRLRQEQLIYFLKQLSFLLKSGVSLSETVTLLRETSTQRPLAALQSYLAESLSKGLALSTIFRQSPMRIPTLVSDWLEIGESQGDLPGIIDVIIAELSERESLKEKLFQQLFYPALVLSLLVLTGGIMIGFVLPSLAQTFLNLGVELPIYIKPVIISLSWIHRHLLLSWSIVFIILIGILGIAWKKHQGLSLSGYLKKVLCKFSKLREITAWSIYIVFARSLQRLLSSGVHLSDAMSLLAKQNRFALVADELILIQGALREGQSFSKSLDGHWFVGDLAMQMLKTAEKTGDLPRALGETTKYYELRLERRLAMMIRIIEPTIIFLLGIFVLFLALSFFLPLLQYYQALLR